MRMATKDEISCHFWGPSITWNRINQHQLNSTDRTRMFTPEELRPVLKSSSVLVPRVTLGEFCQLIDNGWTNRGLATPNVHRAGSPRASSLDRSSFRRVVRGEHWSLTVSPAAVEPLNGTSIRNGEHKSWLLSLVIRSPFPYSSFPMYTVRS